MFGRLMEWQSRVGSFYLSVPYSIYCSLALRDRKYEREDNVLYVTNLTKADTRNMYFDAVCVDMSR